jgi:hypothetical protein
MTGGGTGSPIDELARLSADRSSKATSLAA